MSRGQLDGALRWNRWPRGWWYQAVPCSIDRVSACPHFPLKPKIPTVASAITTVTRCKLWLLSSHPPYPRGISLLWCFSLLLFGSRLISTTTQICMAFPFRSRSQFTTTKTTKCLPATAYRVQGYLYYYTFDVWMLTHQNSCVSVDHGYHFVDIPSCCKRWSVSINTFQFSIHEGIIVPLLSSSTRCFGSKII